MIDITELNCWNWKEQNVVTDQETNEVCSRT
jgi:hypothetical protein